MSPLIRQVLFVSVVTLLSLLAGAALAGDFKRFPEYAYETEKGEVDIEALKRLLREAEALQKSQDEGVKAAADAAEAAGIEAAPAAPAAQAPVLGGVPLPMPVAKPKPKAGGSQAGCMYRDQKLIWEKAPGTCKP